jgi:hypothetical protein
MASAGQESGAGRSGRASQWFWSGFVAVVLVGLLITLFAAIRGGKQWVEARLGRSELPPAWTEVVRVTLSGGQTVYLESAALLRVRAQIRNRIEARRGEAQQILSEKLEAELNRVFVHASQGLPAFVDWYYSLAGEYTRLFHAAMGDLAAYLEQQVDELVFRPAGTTDAIDELAGELDRATAQELRRAARDVHEQIIELISGDRPALEHMEVRVSGEWDLGKQLGEHLEPYLSLGPTDIARQGLATSAGVAASAVVAKKLGSVTVAKVAAKIGAKTSLASVAAKLGVKSAAKAGGTLGGVGAGAATGGAVCAGTVLGASIAPACALVGGAVTGLAVWLMVDKAAIEAEEYLHREDLERELKQTLAEQREDLHWALRRRCVDGVSAAFDGLLEGLESGMQPAPITPKKDFVPARAASPLAPR